MMPRAHRAAPWGASRVRSALAVGVGPSGPSCGPVASRAAPAGAGLGAGVGVGPWALRGRPVCGLASRPVGSMVGRRASRALYRLTACLLPAETCAALYALRITCRVTCGTLPRARAPGLRGRSRGARGGEGMRARRGWCPGRGRRARSPGRGRSRLCRGCRRALCPRGRAIPRPGWPRAFEMGP